MTACRILLVLLFASVPGQAADPAAVAPPAPLSPEAIATNIAKADDRAQEAEARRDEPGLVDALNDEATGRLQQHDFDLAEKLRLRVLGLEEDHAGKDSLSVSDALLNLGWFYRNLARYESARPVLDRCLEIRQRRLGFETAPVAEVLNALGALEEDRSNLALAEGFYRQAIAIQEKVLGLQSPVTANTWNNLATLYWITGNYASAQRLFEKALAVREKSFGPNSLAVARTVNNLALLDQSLGDYDEAENSFLRALKIYTTRIGPERPATITTVSELGQLYVQQGDDAKAEPLLVQAATMRQKIYREDHPDVARSLDQLALLYDREKQYDKAEPLLNKALEIRRRVLGTSHPEYAASLAALARHDHATGRGKEALPLYEQALDIDREALGRNHPDTVEIATDLVYLKLELGQRDEAAALAGDVIEAQQKALNGVFAFTAERQRLDFEHTMQPCELPAALDDPDLMAQVVLRTKGLVLDSLLEDDAAAKAARQPDVQALLEKKQQLAAQLLRGPEEASGADFSTSAEALAERSKLEQEEQELELHLEEKGLGSGRIRRALSTDVDAVRKALPGDAALIEYVAYRRYIGHLNTEPAYGILILTHDAPTRWIPLTAAAGIDAQVRLYQKYLRKRVRETALSGVLQGLHASLCVPVESSLPAGIHRLIISPDGNLNFVSFATLLDDGDHFFAEKFELNYVSSGRDLLEEKSTAPAARRMVVFADPDYGRVKGATDDPLVPLPGTEREAAFLQKEGAADGLSVQLYRGAEASKVNLGKLDSPYVFHLATHGMYLSAEDVPTVPAMAGRDSAKLAAGQAMSRSLLALAGASATLRDWKKGVFPPPENDGLLTAQQVAGLNLHQTWLVALSACDTGGGEAQAGEGVLGLRRGFAEAGAQNLLMTLWAVDDAGTADLMEAFYREALKSGDAPAALAKVQQAALLNLRKKLGLTEAVRQAGPFILSY